MLETTRGGNQQRGATGRSERRRFIKRSNQKKKKTTVLGAAGVLGGGCPRRGKASDLVASRKRIRVLELSLDTRYYPKGLEVNRDFLS